MKKIIFLLFAFVMQTTLFAKSYFPEGTKWTEIRLDTLKYDEWYSKVEGKWVPNYEVIEYYVQGEYAEHRYQGQYENSNHFYSCVYSSGPGWADSLTFFVNKGWSEEFIDWGGEVTVPVFDIDNDPVLPGFLYPFTWDVGDVLTSLAIMESNTTGVWPWDYDEYGTVEKIKEGYFGGVSQLKYSDVNGLRFIQTVGVTTWNDGECIFGPIRPYEVLSAYGAIEPEERHYRSMLVHFERNGEVLYDVWPRKGSAVEVTINGVNFFLYLDSHEAVLTNGRNCSGELDIPSEVSYNDETFTVKSMTYNAFHYNSELTKVKIPKTIENILHSYPYDSDDEDPPTGMVSPDHMNPFRECTAFEAIEVDEENPSFKSINGVLFSQDGVGHYYYLTNEYYGTGLYCYPAGRQQEAYSIPDGVEWIGANAFEGSRNLSTLTIPNSITHIYSCAFQNCNNLTDVYCYADNVPITWDYAFKDTPIASATLHVPAGSIEEYKTTSPWSNFGNIVALPEEPHQPLPFLEGNPIWVYKYEHMPEPEDLYLICWLNTGERYFTYYFLGGKKEIEGKVYTMMGEVTSNGEEELRVNRWLPVREENGIVYAITDSLPGLIEYEYDYLEPPYLQQGNESVLYNFNTEIGETLYPQNKWGIVESYDTYQLMDGTVCRVLKTTSWGYYDLYEKLGYVIFEPEYGVMDPLCGMLVPTNGHVYINRLNAYYQDNTMLYKAADAPEGLCVNDTCWTRNDAEAYAVAYKADPYHEKVMSFIRQLQGLVDPVTFTAGQMATIILPTEPDASKGKYYRLDRVEDGKIVFEQELQPRAHVPYIIVPSEDFSIDLNNMDLEGCSPDTVSIKVRFEGQAESQSIYFIGSYVNEELEQQEGCCIRIIDTTPDCSFSSSGETGKETFLIGALRAYLTWDDPIDHGGAKGRGDMEIVLRDYGTDIKTLSNSPLKGENKYDLSGRKIVNGKWHGIYIENGQKRAK